MDSSVALASRIVFDLASAQGFPKSDVHWKWVRGDFIDMEMPGGVASGDENRC